MLHLFRTKFGPVFIGIFIAFISFVFLFWGVWGPDPGMSGGNAGAVNGSPITLSEFNREYNRRLEMYKGLNLNDEQLKQFGIKNQVFESLVTQKLIAQQADKLGIQPSDSELREAITRIPAFQTDGKFDKAKYEQLLRANRMTPSSFEKSVREDLQLAALRRHVGSFVRVADSEVKEDFLVSGNRRKLKYVWLTPSNAQKSIPVDAKKVDEFLKDETKVKLAKTRFDMAKDTKYKGKTFDAVKSEIARELLATENRTEAEKVNKALAAKVVEQLNHTDASEKKVNELLKSADAQVKDSGWINSRTLYLPGVGKADAVLKDAFADNPPIATRNGGKAKIYEMPGGILVAALVDSESADLSKLTEEEKAKIRERIAFRKENEFSENWLKGLRASAKIVVNDQVMN